MLCDIAQKFRVDGDLQQAEALVAMTLAILDEMSESHANDPAYHAARGEVWNQIAKNRWKRDDREALRQALLVSEEATERAHRLAPDVVEYRVKLDDRHKRVAGFYSEFNRFAEAEAAMLKREGLWPKDASRLATLAKDMRGLASDIDKRGGDSMESGRVRASCLAHAARIEAKRSMPRDGRETEVARGPAGRTVAVP